jgi:phosphoribosylaminoimidazole (AIR) synthetase
MSESILKNDGYNETVVWIWDKYSWDFSEACEKAITELSIRHLLEKVGKTWRVKTWVIRWEDSKVSIDAVTESIDWVWTKIQIYSEVFNSMVENLAEGKITKEKLLETSVELYERMLLDLIAMNVDDLREWEMAVAVTNIIDINHLEWLRGKYFAEAMKIALYNVSTSLNIAVIAWETAILWENEKVSKIENNVTLPQREAWITSTSILDILMSDDRIADFASKNSDLRDYLVHHVSKNPRLLVNVSSGIASMVNEVIDNSLVIYENSQKCLEVILRDISFNIWWTGLWVIWSKEKLNKIREWQLIMYIQEKPTKNCIIWPRSNGITRIRKWMDKIAWEWWAALYFEEFLEKIWEENTAKLPQRLIDECTWLQMWDIATWKTTVFNPFIAREVLWGLENYPIANVSSIIHVTWNPWRKISDWLKWNKDLAVDLDIIDVKIPQIIEILQLLWWIDDDDAIWSWNMWVPYVMIIDW